MITRVSLLRGGQKRAHRSLHGIILNRTYPPLNTNTATVRLRFLHEKCRLLSNTIIRVPFGARSQLLAFDHEPCLSPNSTRIMRPRQRLAYSLPSLVLRCLCVCMLPAISVPVFPFSPSIDALQYVNHPVLLSWRLFSIPLCQSAIHPVRPKVMSGSKDGAPGAILSP